MTAKNSLSVLLASGLRELELDCSPAQQEQLLSYVQLLDKWNKVYNLTAVRDPREMVTRHLLDSLSVLPYLQGERVLDVGTGAGLPGIPLAIVSPTRKFVLLDSNNKKTRFVQQAITELGLVNVTVAHARVEDFHAAAAFDVVLSRAFASITDMLLSCARHCAQGGVMLAMKGANPTDELIPISQGYTVEDIHRLQVPGLDEERHVVCLRQAEIKKPLSQ